jgi:Uma2 family endonuclease
MRCELVNGTIYMMAAPSMDHQLISMELSHIFRSFLDDKPCRVLASPVDVRLEADPDEDENRSKNDDTVCQPDLIVVCDRKKLQKKACIGAPDLAIEILSPSTKKHDMETKYREYLTAGVREYWIVDPDAKTIMCGILTEHPGGFYDYNWQTYKEGGMAPVGIFDGKLLVDVTRLFKSAELEEAN